TDNTSAHAHASPLAVAIALKQLGMEPVMQLTCRDRNRIALEAEIAGAALHGIENICCLTGDDVTAGDEPEARRVFDLDSIQLLALGRTMMNGTYLSGRKIDPAPHLFLGATENAGAPPYDHRVDRALKKVRAGARFLQLQVSFRPEQLAGFVTKELASQVALLPSICLVRSPRSLRYIDEHVPGIEVPPEIIERCESAADPEAECFEVACELAEHARSLPGVAGLHLISFRREAGIARLCQRLGIPTRETRADSRPVAV
ncbi:MAG: methylenetetrahydrofolate reductase, partial [Gaiellaceae bacterium]